MEESELERLLALEQRVNKLFTIVVEGNGKDSIVTSIALLGTKLDALSIKSESEDRNINTNLEYIKETLSGLLSTSKPKTKEIDVINTEGKWTVITAIIGGIITIATLVISTANLNGNSIDSLVNTSTDEQAEIK